MISVIIPTYNRGNTIKRAIDSIIAQNRFIKEIIIIDDNSEDNTKDVVESIDDKRILYYKSDIRLGACKARNIGIKMSTGKFIAFHDSDDVWHSDKVEKQISIINKTGCDIVCSAYTQYIDNKINYMGKNVENDKIYEELLKGNFIGTPTILGKSCCFKENMFDENLPRFQDWDLMIRLSKKYEVNFINESLVDAYVQSNSITKSKQSALIALKIILEKNIEEMSKNKKIMEQYYRIMGISALYLDDDYKFYFKKAFSYRKSIKSFIDFMFSAVKMKFILKILHSNN